MLSKPNFLAIENFAPALIKKSAVIEKGIAQYHKVSNLRAVGTHYLATADANTKYHIGNNQSSSFNKNSQFDFGELAVGTDRLEINVEVSADAVRDTIFGRLYSNLDDRRPQDLSEHEFKREVLVYLGELLAKRVNSDLDWFLLYGKDVFGDHLGKLSGSYPNFKMTGLLSGTQVELVSDKITLQDNANGVTITVSKVDLGNGTEQVTASFSVPTSVADLSYLQGRRVVKIYNIDGSDIIPFDARISSPYNVSGTNQSFAIKFTAPIGLTYAEFEIAKNDNIEAILSKAVEHAADLRSQQAEDVKLVMNERVAIQYNLLVHSGVAIAKEFQNLFSGFEVVTVPALYDGIMVASPSICHVVSGHPIDDMRLNSFEFYDLSQIGEYTYRGRLSMLIGAQSQYEYAKMFI